MRCSVVVPVWNPGPNLDRCVDSLLEQSMPADDYEIVLVDDGSTDGSADRLDTLAALHPDRIRVIHTPPSGWPGRPRNIGIDAARGTYVHLVDNDDRLPAYALEAMCDAADRDESDVVIGRPATDFRGIYHAMYRQDRHGVTLADFPELVQSTTPHKMFRREFLHRHDIRFPEGVPREDQPFVLRAYINAASVTVLTDRCYYFYLRRLGSGRNAGDQSIDPAPYFRALETILDVLDAEVPDGSLRDLLARRFYIQEVLNLMWAVGTLNAPPEIQRQLFDDARRIATTRFGPGVRSGAGAVHRTLGALVEKGDVADTLEFGRQCRRIASRADVSEMHWAAGTLVLTIDPALVLEGEPLHCEPVSGGWALPAALAPTVSPADRLLDPARDLPDADVMLQSRIDSVMFGLGSSLRVIVDDSGVIRVTGTIRIDPETAMAGARLSEGLWDLRLRLWFAGFSRVPFVRVQCPEAAPPPLITDSARMVRPFVDDESGHLTLDVGGWLRSPASTLAPSSHLAVVGSGRLRLHVLAQADTETPLRLQFTSLSQEGGPSFGCVGTLVGAADGTSAAILRPPSNLPDGDWQPWLQPASPAASPPVALPWLVRRSKRELQVHPAALLARGQLPDGPAQRARDKTR